MIDPKKIRPPHWILTLLCSAIFLQVLFSPNSIASRSYSWFGALFFIGGVIIMVLAHKQFMKHETPPSHAEKPQKLVVEGIYRYSRNPMYVAGGFIFLGIAISVGTWPFFLAWILMGLILHKVYIPWEEKGMEELFGEDYRNYKKRVRRWL